MTGYAELHCVSNFSFLRGASHPHELVERAAVLGYRALALTDDCSLAGVVRAHQAAAAVGLHLIIGCELCLDAIRLVLLVENRAGYARLSRLISRARRRAAKGEYRLERADLETGLPGCLALWLAPQGRLDNHAVDGLRWLATRFAGRLWLAAELLNGADDARRLRRLLALAEALNLPALAAGDVHMHERSRRYLQNTLTAIRLGCPLAAAGRRLQVNGERYLRPLAVLRRRYPQTLLAATVEVADRCRFSLAELRYQYPHELVPAGLTPSIQLRRLALAGLRWRWPEGCSLRVRKLLVKELALIAELRFETYFLTVHDIVRFARRQGILCQGRGSAANSVLCYCLGITAVNPDYSAMLFGRFISRERNEPPDIDVDFEHQRREEVLQYIYAKYGRERAALAATVIRYRGRSAVRDVGKALGLAADQIERLIRVRGWHRGELRAEQLREAGFDPYAPVWRRLRYLVNQLLGFPRHLSQHVGGMVMAHGALCELVPIENAAMSGRTVIQWDKDDLDAVGLLKVDCLALGMLSALRRALALVNDYRGVNLTLADIPADDPATYAMIRRADTVGVFQIESRAQMTMLPRLKPVCFYDLVIEVAIMRPGPIQGQMVHPYLRRRRGQEKITYPGPALRAVLERTLGVPLFQEQVMALAIVAAGFSPGEADRLRRAMTSWGRAGDLSEFRQRFYSGMLARGYRPALAERLYRMVEGFSGYGFPESHAASFALLVYVSAWLKCHHPAAFCAALLNSQPLGFYAPAQLIQDTRRHGVEVRPVSVAQSAWDCTLERCPDGPALRLGLRQIKGFGVAAGRRLEAARAARPFADITDLARRAGLDQGALRALARAGALRGLTGHRRRALWAVLGADAARSGPLVLPVPEPPARLAAPSAGETVMSDYAAQGFSLHAHPLRLLRERLHRRRLVTAEELNRAGHGWRGATAGLVIARQRPSTAKGTVFLTLEDETGLCNVIVPARLAERERLTLSAARLLQAQGVAERDGRVLQLQARRLVDLSALLGRLATRSRDFC